MEGLSFTTVLYSFFHCEISEVRGPISAKFGHTFGSMFNLQMPVGAENMQNLARFWTPSHFERKYLRNR